MIYRTEWQTLILLTVIGIGYGCSLDTGSRGPFGPEDPETAVRKTKLPDKLPAPHIFKFTGEDIVGHHKPKMAGAISDTALRRTANASVVPTSRQVATFRSAAESDRRVTALLGSRWAFIDAERIPPEGKISFSCCRDTAMRVRLVYYSYSQNVAIEVRMVEIKEIGVPMNSDSWSQR